jgi:sugar (pentulose or hexulose) kinase
MKFHIGIDIGTTNTKAFAVGENGVLLHKESIKNQTFSPQYGFQEQNPVLVFRGVLSVLKRW